MILHARIYNILSLVQVDLFTMETGPSGELIATSVWHAGAEPPARLASKHELFAYLEALVGAGVAALQELEGDESQFPDPGR